jgi:hypothetical protein
VANNTSRTIASLIVLFVLGCGDPGESSGTDAGGQTSSSSTESGMGAFDAGSSSGGSSSGGSSSGGSAGAGASTPGDEPFAWYPALDLATIPFHTGSGSWGEQRTVVPAAAPVVSGTVDVATVDELTAALSTGGLTIRLTADIIGGTNEIRTAFDFDIHDCDLDLNGHLLSNVVFGGYFDATSGSRIRFRSGTEAVHGDGSRLHYVQFFGEWSDVIMDSIDITGPGHVNGGDSSALGVAGTMTRLNIVNSRIAAGCNGYLGTASDLIVAGCSVMTGLFPDPPSNDEAWGFRVAVESTGYHIFFRNDIRGNRYHRIRSHPIGSSNYGWIVENTFVDRNESRILWVNSAAGNSGVDGGDLSGWWTLRNRTWATGGVPSWECIDGQYVRVEDNEFHSDTFTSDGVFVVVEPPATDVVVRGNTYGPLDPDPPWGGPGDPSGLDWQL